MEQAMKRTNNEKIAIIGGGAAGLMTAAVLVTECKGAQPPQVVVMEQASRLGKKLLATGNGRCNLYNRNLEAEHFFSQNPQALAQGVDTIRKAGQLALWEKLGLMTQADEEGRVYPICYQAAAVLELLRRVCEQGGVEFRCDAQVVGITKTGPDFQLELAGGETLRASQVVLATGGKAAPNLSGGGQGGRLAKALGHTLRPHRPGLVPLRCKNPSKSLKGVRAQCGVSLYRGDTLVERRQGEVQFTDYGVSGIVIMQLSNYWEPGDRLELDLFPQLEEEALLSCFQRKQQAHPGQRGDFLLLGLLKTQFSEVILRASRVDGKKRSLGSLTREELALIARRVKHWSVQVEGTLSWEQAQVTLGGVALEEVEMDTFQSRLVPGLYLTGEILDGAGDCGGFNLAWAFGSAMAAGRAILGDRG
jgi:hypothetical protein